MPSRAAPLLLLAATVLLAGAVSADPFDLGSDSPNYSSALPDELVAHKAFRAEWDVSAIDVDNDGQVAAMYKRYTTFFNKTALEGAGASPRLEVFKDNLKYIRAVNAKTKHFQLGVTPFTDMTWEEFSEQVLVPKGFEPVATETPATTAPVAVETLPETKDWSAHTSSPRQQGHCGSCFVFATLDALTAHRSIQGAGSKDLSVEHVLDCMFERAEDAKCRGGQPTAVYDWIKGNGGVALESEYPYQCAKGLDGACMASKCNSLAPKSATVTGFTAVSGEDQMMEAVAAKGPVAFTYEVTRSFQHYIVGVITKDDQCTGPINHAMLMTGYNKRWSFMGGTPYWNIQNSWGRFWGELGYVRVVRGDALCGLGSSAVYPTI